jgi:hypothetical protein
MFSSTAEPVRRSYPSHNKSADICLPSGIQAKDLTPTLAPMDLG